MPGIPLKLIAGLGNPGPEYAATRHNAGFQLVDELARRHGGAFRRDSRHQADLTRVRIGGEEIWLIKPMTYMNRSGGPVRSLATFYKLPVDSVLVAYDELDFPPGIVRLRQGGGTGGHLGMKDLIPKLGEEFWRLRIGIGHPGDKALVPGYVLGVPSSTDGRLIEQAVQSAADAVPVLLADGPEKAMKQLHTAPSAARP